jgi:hypothetical protein
VQIVPYSVIAILLPPSVVRRISVICECLVPETGPATVTIYFAES